MCAVKSRQAESQHLSTLIKKRSTARQPCTASPLTSEMSGKHADESMQHSLNIQTLYPDNVVQTFRPVMKWSSRKVWGVFSPLRLDASKSEALGYNLDLRSQIIAWSCKKHETRFCSVSQTQTVDIQRLSGQFALLQVTGQCYRREGAACWCHVVW